ncbi:MAG: gamma-glutamyltransferase [bacterium]
MSQYVPAAAAVPLVLLLFLAGACGEGGSEDRPTTLAGRSTVYAPRGAVAASQPLATSAGLAVLEQGGNAIDAAVTAAAVLTVTEPHMTGIGGDVFAIVWSAEEGALIGLNASGRSGSRMTRQALRERDLDRVPLFGAEPVTVPGALSGWSALLERFGTIELAQALGPAIRLAEEGFPVSPKIARQWAAETGRLTRDEGARDTYLMEDGTTPRAGEWFRNPDYASTLRAIARRGPGHLYGGELGRTIAEHLQQEGGFLTPEDLRAHRVEWVEPVGLPFHGYTVWELPPNGQGIAALEMLGILETFDLEGMGHNSPAYLHHLIEAKKQAFADLEAYVGDPTSMEASPEDLLEEDFLRRRREAIHPREASEGAAPGELDLSSETIYLTAADSRGNMVSFINSIYWEFGSGVVVPGTGFALQNRGAGFTTEPDHPNTVGPGKRPFHTLIPGFVTRTGSEGGIEPWLAFGVMGGSMQPQGHVQLLLNLLVFGMDLQEAVDAPRFRHLGGRRVALEAPIPGRVRGELTRMGHELTDEGRTAFGGAQAILRLAPGWAAASDPRKDGQAGGH